jgi:GntR family transcriptional regulator of arabinose operon
MDKTLKLYETVYEDLLRKINTGELRAGDRLPTEYELIDIYNVSRTTVIRAVKELQKNKLIARSPRSGTFVAKKANHEGGHYIIPMILPYDDIFNSAIIDGANEYAVANNCFISFFNSHNINKEEREILIKLLKVNTAGLIIYPCSMYSNIDIFSNYIINRIPIVFLDRRLPGITSPLITSNNKKGFYNLVCGLIDKGHRRIAYYCVSNNMLPTENERFEGYCEALIKNGISINFDYVMRFYEDIRHKYANTPVDKKPALLIENVRRMINQYLSLEEKPTVICCVNDETAILLTGECKKLGIAVPEVFSITGFGYTAEARSSMPALTTVRQNFYEFGKSAAKNILAQIDGYYSDSRIDTEIIWGDSVKDLNAR